jgi:hypothetical protein
MILLAFFIGLFIGFTLGVFALAFFIGGSRGDPYE